MDWFRKARDKGGDYLLAKQHPDGGVGAELTEYCKTLSALQVCGYNHAANRLCQWIRTHHMTPDGDFGPRSENTADHSYTYANSWVIIGAHRLGQLDISQKGMDFLMDFWDPQSGGFYCSPTRRDADTEQHLIYIGFCGLAALSTGRIEVARAVGRWMRTVLEAQPNFPQKLYTVYSPARGLHTSPDPEEDIRYVVSRDAARDQFFFQPGVAAAFLARLFQATGEMQWLDLAKAYLHFAEGANDYLFRLLRAGKVGWAASILYTLTGEKKYQQMAVRVGHNLIAAQSRKGYWTALGGKKPSGNLTAEMVIWLDEIHQAVGHE